MGMALPFLQNNVHFFMLGSPDAEVAAAGHNFNSDGDPPEGCFCHYFVDCRTDLGISLRARRNEHCSCAS
jgi:hypothetical protein